eukprot:GHVT01029791.1.p1 GENE.GHVT01029791.1~~GHVT01029791.1.p1  ORF type:complete len:351 (-),score=55.59 GHVT01029791.1:2185-3237(-)
MVWRRFVMRTSQAGGWRAVHRRRRWVAGALLAAGEGRGRRPPCLVGKSFRPLGTIWGAWRLAGPAGRPGGRPGRGARAGYLLASKNIDEATGGLRLRALRVLTKGAYSSWRTSCIPTPGGREAVEGGDPWCFCSTVSASPPELLPSVSDEKVDEEDPEDDREHKEKEIMLLHSLSTDDEISELLSLEERSDPPFLPPFHEESPSLVPSSSFRWAPKPRKSSTSSSLPHGRAPGRLLYNMSRWPCPDAGGSRREPIRVSSAALRARPGCRAADALTQRLDRGLPPVHRGRDEPPMCTAGHPPGPSLPAKHAHVGPLFGLGTFGKDTASFLVCCGCMHLATATDAHCNTVTF